MVKKVANFLNQKNTVTSASVILIITLFLSNVLGVLRDHYLTQKIVTDDLSVYYAAFRIPDFIFNILILGAITSAFIPVFTNLITRKKEQEAWLVASSVINIAIILLVGIAIILAVTMPWLMPFVIPGFSEEKKELATQLARIMLFSPIFFGLSYIFSGILNSFKRFTVYALAPLVYNLTIILGTIFLADSAGIKGIAFAVVVGAFLHFLIQLPIASKLGFNWTPKIDWKHWGVKRIGLLMIPRALALGASQIMLWIFTAMASFLGSYSIAAYNLADNIQTMPMVVFGTSFATAIFPTLSEAVSADRLDEFKIQIIKTMRTVLFFLVPMTVIFILLRTQMVRILYGSGHFGWEQTITTANTLGYFAISLVFTGLNPLFSRAYFALHNTKIPMISTFSGALISVLLGKLLAPSMGVSGLALAFSIGSAISFIFLYVPLIKKVNFRLSGDFCLFLTKILVASILMGLVIQGTKNIISGLVNMHTFLGIAAQTLTALIVGLAVYIGLCLILRCEEVSSIKHVFRKYAYKRSDDEETAKSEDLI